MSASLNTRPEMGAHWIKELETDVFIDGNQMHWTALREDNNGQRFTATFEMTKVN